MSKIKKEDRVLIFSGNHKGTEGVVSKIYSKKNKVFIRGINMVKKHSKPSIKNPKGGIIEKEAPIHISNLKKMK